MRSPGFLDGLALAATLAGDRGGDDDPTGVRRNGLVPELADALRARLDAMRDERAGSRERALTRMVGAVRPAVDPDAPMPPRAAALLAVEVPRAIAARWMSASPMPRAGFRVAPALRATLRRYAYRPPAPDRTQRDRGAGRVVLASVMRSEGAPPWQRILALLPPEEAAAVLALEAMPQGFGGAPIDDATRARRLAFLAAALDAGAESSLLEALGAMERGAREAHPDASDRWARAGREIEEMGGHPCPE